MLPGLAASAGRSSGLMKARVFSRRSGARCPLLAFSKVAASGPCSSMLLCRLTPPGTKPSAFASYTPRTRPINSLMTFLWNQGGRKVSSATSHRGGKITKSQLATPSVAMFDVSTVLIEGSGWSKFTVPIAMKWAVSYLYGTRLPCHAMPRHPVANAFDASPRNDRGTCSPWCRDGFRRRKSWPRARRSRAHLPNRWIRWDPAPAA